MIPPFGNTANVAQRAGDTGIKGPLRSSLLMHLELTTLIVAAVVCTVCWGAAAVAVKLQ